MYNYVYPVMSLSSATDAIKFMADAAFFGSLAMDGYFTKQEEKAKQKKAVEDLHEKLSDEKVCKSFDCMEGLPQEVRAEKKEKDKRSQNNESIKFIRDDIPKYGLTVASIMHVLASLSKTFNFLPQALSDFFHVNSTRLSKAFNFVNYTVKGVDALKHKRSWDALGRLAYSVIVPFQDQEDVFLSSGISSGITMFEQGQRHKVPNGDKPKDIVENFGHNISAYVFLYM